MDINIKSINRSTSHFLHRYHVIIFVIVVFGALGAGIFTIYQNILSADEANGYTAQTNNTTFDPTTTENIANLHTSDYRQNPGEIEGAESTLDERSLSTGGRINPFVE